MIKSMQKIPTGYKQTEIGTIPADWDIKQLGDIGESLIGLTYKPSDVSHEGTLVLRSSNIQSDKLSFEDNVYVDVDIPEKIRVKNGDILVCVRNGSRSLIGKCALLDTRVEGQTFGAFMGVFRTKYYQFVFRQFQSNNIQRQINENIGATINQITNKNLNSFKIAFPNKEEERSAIGDVLFDVDNLISKLEALIQKKKLIKQGAMQELLTSKRRLPGFSGEWEKRRLASICDIEKGSQINRSNLSDAGKYPAWNGGVEPSGYAENWNTEKNTITISEGGNSCGFVNFCDERFWCGGHCYAVKNVCSGVHPIFLYHKLKFSQEIIMGLRVGSGLPNIQKKNLLNLEVSTPKSEGEQIAITHVLSDMDAEIQRLESQLSKYQNIKQGMMQTLLTGKIRLL